MNEYIILHDGLNPEITRLIKVSTILSWVPHKLGTGHLASILKCEEENIGYSWRIHESPAEIEALIMGYSLPEVDEVDDSYKNKPTFSAREINTLKDDMEKLKEENAFLKEKIKEENGYYQGVVESYNENIKENAKLKEELSSYKTNLMRYELLHGNSHLHSNPANPCCRETFNKLNEYYGGMNINYFCDSKEEVDERGQLECWRQSFKDKIQENKNDL